MAVRLSSGSRRGDRRTELRPTSARTLVSVFGMLAGELTGRRVLDLYAGVGSFGIMALRNGAARAVFVDKSHEAERRLRRALVHFHLEKRAEVFREDVRHFLHKTERWSEPFEIIFCDPPYDEVMPEAVIEEILDAGMLAAGGVLVFEHSRRQAPPDIPRLKLRRSRVIGETTISIWDHP